MSELILVPQPRQMTHHDGDPVTLSHDVQIIAQDELPRAVAYLQETLSQRGYEFVENTSAFAITLSLDDSLPAQGYTLTVAPEGITITSGDAAGAFYGVCTLRQLLINDESLPRLTISDHPDILQRGYMLDISRDRVPTLASLLDLIDTLAALKYNQLQLYTEHTFAYACHEIVWRDASPLTADDIRVTQARCQARHMTLVPNQNSLGHVERWLKHEPYQHLAEKPDGFTGQFNRHRTPSTLNPLDPASLELMRDLYDQLLPLFDVDVVNVGCDEPWELGEGKSADAVAERGGRVYLDWLLALRQLVTEHGKQMQFWGDIIINHPELLPEIPDDVTLLEWGYEGNHPFDERGKLYADAGIDFYMCPGTSSWNTLVGRVDNANENIRSAVEASLKYGASGVLITDWGDYGHWQPPVISLPPLTYGAGVMWYLDGNENLDLKAALDVLIFEDEKRIIGDVLLTLGKLYHRTKPEHVNGQVLAYVLQLAPDEISIMQEHLEAWGGEAIDMRPETLRSIQQEIDAQLERLQNAAISDDLRDTISHAAKMLRHGADYLLWQQGEQARPADELLAEWDALHDEQRRIWLLTSREGGLADSLRGFAYLREAYRAN